MLFAVFFIACNQDDSYTIKGEISDLQSNRLYFVPANDSVHINRIDTVFTKNGKFTYTGNSTDFSSVIIYIGDKNSWITVWVKNGQNISIKGNANSPELILAKGGTTNDLLAQFKKENSLLIKERGDLQDKLSAKKRDSEENTLEGSDIQISSQILNLNQLLKKQAQDFVELHLSEFASLVLILDYILDTNDLADIKPYLAQITGEIRKTDLFKELEALSTRDDAVAIGNPAPEFCFTSTENDTLSLERYKDKYLLLTFMASWCNTCKPEFEKLTAIQKDFSDKDLEILTVSIDENSSDWMRLAKEKEFLWDQRIENKGWASPVVSKYRIQSIPFLYLIDKNGMIINSGSSIDSIRFFLENQEM